MILAITIFDNDNDDRSCDGRQRRGEQMIILILTVQFVILGLLIVLMMSRMTG